MESPIRSIRYIHNALRKECRELEDAVGQLAAEDRAGAEECGQRHAFLYDVVKIHEDGEEEALFPMIDQGIYPVSAPYLLDHRVDQMHLRETIADFGRLGQTEDPGARAKMLRQISRSTIILNAAMTLHIEKEEQIIVPLVEERISPADQVATVQRSIAGFGPELMQKMFPWIVRAQTPEDQELFLAMFVMNVPPTISQALIQRLSQELSPDEWVEVEKRLPKVA
jgi:hemerythrin-like domain-containing protein